MESKLQSQPLDPFDVYIDMKRKRVKQNTLARRLRRSKGAITHAFHGKSPRLLARIKRYLDKIPAKAAQ